jgi:hypothetical protein
MKGDDCDGLVKLFDEDPESLAVIMAGNAGNAYSSMTAVEPDCLRCWRCLSRWNLSWRDVHPFRRWLLGHGLVPAIKVC